MFQTYPLISHLIHLFHLLDTLEWQDIVHGLQFYLNFLHLPSLVPKLHRFVLKHIPSRHAMLKCHFDIESMLKQHCFNLVCGWVVTLFKNLKLISDDPDVHWHKMRTWVGFQSDPVTLFFLIFKKNSILSLSF